MLQVSDSNLNVLKETCIAIPGGDLVNIPQYST